MFVENGDYCRMFVIQFFVTRNGRTYPVSYFHAPSEPPEVGPDGGRIDVEVHQIVLRPRYN